MNHCINSILNSANIRSTLNAIVNNLQIPNEPPQYITHSMVFRLTLWNQIQPSFSIYINHLWEMAIARTSSLFVQYCIISQLTHETDYLQVMKWIHKQRIKPMLFVDLPNSLIFYIQSFLDNKDTIKFATNNRLYIFDWLNSENSKSIYSVMAKIQFDNNIRCRVWQEILGVKRLAFLLLFDDRCICNNDLINLLNFFHIKPQLNMRIWQNLQLPLMVKSLVDDVFVLICQFLNYPNYCALSSTCRWYYSLLQNDFFANQMFCFEKLKLDELSFVHWRYGLSKLDLWRRILIIENNILGKSYLSLSSTQPLQNFTPQNIVAYFGHTFNLSKIENQNTYTNLQLVLCDRSLSVLNHGFNDLWQHPLSHFILYSNSQAHNPMHIHCHTFIAANGDLGITYVVNLFARNYCKIFVNWNNTLWNNDYVEQTHLGVPAPHVQRDKHLIWINVNNWTVLLQLTRWPFITFCVLKFTLILT